MAKSDKENLETGLEWEEIKTEHIVQDEWIDFRRCTYRFPNGQVFEPYYTYSRKSYVVIVASDTEGRYLCVQQFRQGINQVTTEFPAGGIEKEDILSAAKRELAEETGYKSDEWCHLLTVPSNATMADNYAHIFVAKNCSKVSSQSLDETEFLNVKLYSSDEIEHMITDGKFQQAVHIMAWLLAQKNTFTAYSDI
jgi:ADP-ribose pyrophosphatase